MSSGFLGGGIGPTAIKRRGGLAAPVPVVGAEQITNGGFATDTAWTKGAGWSIPGDGTAVATDASGVILQAATPALVAGGWYLAAIDVVALSAGIAILRIGEGGPGITGVTTTGNYWVTLRVAVTGSVYVTRTAANLTGAIDNISVKRLTLSSLFSTAAYASANCDLSAAVTRAGGTQAGLVARLDSATSPANFVIAYLDGGGNVKVDKCVAGTYTNVISGAVTYAAGRVLRLVCSGNSVSAYYNGTQVGSTVTVSDAGIVSNTRHGLFSTYASNSFAGYVAA